jgi:excinuclease UvrABC nuclease subunit
MKIEQLSPKPNNEVNFKLSSYKIVPKIPGCYILVTFEYDILYIGQTKNLYNRFQQHLDDPHKTQLTIIGKAVRFFYMEYDMNNLPKLERTWLNQYVSTHGELPILNKVYSPVS